MKISNRQSLQHSYKFVWVLLQERNAMLLELEGSLAVLEAQQASSEEAGHSQQVKVSDSPVSKFLAMFCPRSCLQTKVFLIIYSSGSPFRLLKLSTSAAADRTVALTSTQRGKGVVSMLHFYSIMSSDAVL